MKKYKKLLGLSKDRKKVKRKLVKSDRNVKDKKQIFKNLNLTNIGKTKDLDLSNNYEKNKPSM